MLIDKQTAITGTTCVLFHILHVIVNKYVLTDLNFTFPTVFQGWINLVKLLTLLLVARYQPFIELSSLRWLVKQYRLLPSVILYSTCAYTGSVTLSILPIPTFLALSALPLLVNRWFGWKFSDHRPELFLLSFLMIIACVLVAITENVVVEPLHGFLWITVHISTQVLLELTVYMSEDDFSYWDRSLAQFAGSTIVFLPMTALLGEAHSAFHTYPYFRLLSFYVGVVVSGLTGSVLAIAPYVWIDGGQIPLLDCVSRAFTVLASLLVFARHSSPLHVLWCLLSLLLPALAWYCEHVQMHRTLEGEERVYSKLVNEVEADGEVNIRTLEAGEVENRTVDDNQWSPMESSKEEEEEAGDVQTL